MTRAGHALLRRGDDVRENCDTIITTTCGARARPAEGNDALPVALAAAYQGVGRCESVWHVQVAWASLGFLWRRRCVGLADSLPPAAFILRLYTL